jgi:DNA gyrase subunit A
MGRSAAGVTAIRLEQGDFVTSMEVIEEGGELVQLTRHGFGKRTPLADYPPKGRATGGVQTIDKKALEKIGSIASARVVQPGDDLTIISTGGQALRFKVANIPQGGRSSRGARLIDLQAGDTVSTMARISAELIQDAKAGDNGSG